MKFLLINPFCPIAENPTPPLGISYLAAALEEAGIEVKVLDYVVTPYSPESLAKTIKAFHPKIVGVTAVTMSFNDGIKVISDAKSISPGTLTVMGGPHVSFCAEETLKSFPALDIVVIGEGEVTVVELAQELEEKGEWDKVKGIAFRQGKSIRFTENRPLLDVNKLPLPARHLIPLGRYKALNTPISMTTSRGCPFRCIFCIGRKILGGKVRYRDPQLVVDEFERLASLGFFQINISDDLFTARAEHCLSICSEILRRGIKTRWTSFARVDRVSPEVLTKMKEAGCEAVSFGVETANEKILKTIKKGITLPKVVDAIKMCVDAGILPHISFILGLPFETPDTLQETLNFAKEIESLGGIYGYHLLAPFPGTAIRDEAEKYDIRILTNDWSQYHANRAIVETSKVSREMMDQMAIDWENLFQSEMDKIRRKMEKGEATEDESLQIVNMERFFFIYDLMMKELIESNGRWINNVKTAHTKSDELSELADRIYRHTSQDRTEVEEILKYLHEKGTLRCTTNESNVHWQWTEYL